ncbi:MAG TPA: ABC transporter ATP-binding protein, partial [Chloroflexota bacterium]
AFHDRLQRAQQDASYRPLNLVVQLSYGLMGLVGLLGTLTLLATVDILAPIALLVLGLPYLYVQARSGQAAYISVLWQSPRARRIGYLGAMTAALDVAKEVRLFGLADYLLRAYRLLGQQILQEMLRVLRFQSIGSALTATLAMAGYFGAYLYFIAQVLARRLTLGDLTVYTGAFLQGGMQAQAISQGIGAVLENGLFLRDLFEFLDLAKQTDAPAHLVDPPAPNGRTAEPAAGIVFESVSFRYPGATDDALGDFSLHIPRGTVVALVGENGAGKTTLIKLLCRLYDPTAGRILLDGTDIRDIEPADLRANFGVLFQDFVHYFLTARENVGFGDTRHIDDLARVRAVSQRAGVDQTIAALPEGYETMLGKMFEDGYDLSGGEWQRLAMARAYMRDAPILILDEPTANLDPRAEQKIFDEVRRLLIGRTAIVISHRFSTVRLASHIYVLHEGRLVEHGTHDTLMAAGGRYAELYDIQAAAYR